MPRFAANLSFLFAELPFLERFGAAARAGFGGVEYLFPYEYAARDIAECLRQHLLEQVLFNLPAGDWAAGERGLACLPGRQAEFVESVERARTYALALGCRRLHCMAGLRPADSDGLELAACYVDNLRHAADRLAPDGIALLVEPINSRIDMPGYWLDDIEQAVQLLDRIGRPNVMLQLDLYHAQIIRGDLARTIGQYFGRIGHVQIADNPGRHEPGTGEINFAFLFNVLDRLGYTGWLGCEYKPLTTTEAGLGWLMQSLSIPSAAFRNEFR